MILKFLKLHKIARCTSSARISVKFIKLLGFKLWKFYYVYSYIFARFSHTGSHNYDNDDDDDIHEHNARIIKLITEKIIVNSY